jgi:hypothetical protein
MNCRHDRRPRSFAMLIGIYHDHECNGDTVGMDASANDQAKIADPIKCRHCDKLVALRCVLTGDQWKATKAEALESLVKSMEIAP